MPYPELLITPMREDLTRHGVIEARSPEQVDELLGPDSGTVMIVVNSVCGCAAGKARPGIVMSLQGAVKPEKVATVFAGADIEATARLREKLSMYPPSSPAVALFRDGEPIFMLHRHEIERREAPQIAEALTAAYEKYCAHQEA